MNRKDAVNDMFVSQTSKLCHEMLLKFKKQAGAMVIPESGWNDLVNQHKQELDGQLHSIIKNQREREMDKMHRITTKATYETIEEIVSPPIYELRMEFWNEIRDPYINEILEVLANCKSILRNGFEVDQLEEADFTDKFEGEIKEYT